MAVRKDVRLDVVAETKRYQAEFAKIPGITQKQAAKAAMHFTRESVKAQQAAEKAARQAANKSAATWKTAMGTAMGVISADALRAAGQAVANFGQGVADARNQIGDMSGQTALATETLAGLRVATRNSGGQLSDLASGLKALPKNLQDFADGTGEARGALERLGFEQADAATMLQDVDGAFRDIVARLQAVEEPGQRAALATKVFGESGVVLAQVLGDVPLDTFVGAARDFGDNVGPEAIKQAQQWELATSRLETAFDRAKGELFDFLNLGGNLESFTLGFVYLQQAARTFASDLVDNFKIAGQVLSEVSQGNWRAALEVAKTQKSAADMFGRAGDEALEAAKKFWDQTEAMKGAAAGAGELSQGLSRTTDEQKKAAQASREAQAALERQFSGYRELSRIIHELNADTLTAEQQAALAHAARVERIHETTKATGDLAAEQRALAAAEARYQRELDQISQERWDAEWQRIQETMDRNAAYAEQILEDHRRTVQAVTDMSLGYMGELASAAEQLAGQAGSRIAQELEQERAHRQQLHQERQRLEEELRATESETERQRIRARLREIDAEKNASKKTTKERQRAAVRAAEATRNAALFGIAANTAEAVLKAFAMFGPPPSPVGIGAAAAAGSAGLIQAGIVMNEPLPTYHLGGRSSLGLAPDERVARVLEDEAVLNRRARRKLGDEQIDRLNGSGDAGIGGPRELRLEFHGRALQRVFLDQLHRPGPLQAAVLGPQDYGTRNPYSGS